MPADANKLHILHDLALDEACLGLAARDKPVCWLLVAVNSSECPDRLNVNPCWRYDEIMDPASGALYDLAGCNLVEIDPIAHAGHAGLSAR